MFLFLRFLINNKFFCRCLHYFGSKKLEAHTVDCSQMNDCAIRLSSEDDKWLSFNNYCRKKQVPFIVYADLKCILKTEENHMYQHHRVFNIGYYVHCLYDSLSFYWFHRNKDCVAFTEQLRDLVHNVKTTITANVLMVDFDYEKFNSVTHCHVCEKPFAPDDTRVRDHCHLTGQYRGPAHSNCNLNYRDLHYIPIVFHNLSGYDAHFIIKEIATAYEGQVDLLPITKEKYISFTKNVKSTENKDKKNLYKIVIYRFI